MARIAAHMRPPADNRVRLVIQEVRGPGFPSYRVIAYPRRACMRDEPATFSSFEELLARFKEALPGVDELVLAAGKSRTQILLAREFELSDDQLKVLGLAR
jgi:hypothetical protein